MQNELASDAITPLNRGSTPLNQINEKSSNLARRKTDAIPNNSAKRTNETQVYYKHIYAHYNEPLRLKHMERIEELGAFLSNRGKTYSDAEPVDLRNFLAWIQKKTLSREITRQYVISLVDFYLILLQEGIVIKNTVYTIYPLLTEKRLPKEEELDTSESMYPVPHVSESIDRHVTEPPQLFPLKKPPIISPRVSAYNKENSKTSLFGRNLKIFEKQGPLHTRLMAFLFVAIFLILFNYVPFVTNALQVGVQSAADLVSDQEPTDSNPVSQSLLHDKRRDLFYHNNLHHSFCKTVLKLDCQTDVIPSNPLNPTWENLTNGQSLFKEYCQECHGIGKSIGSRAQNMDPPPSRLKFAGKGILHKDIYLYWSIFDGGIALGTGMPSFKTILEDNEIWQIILFMDTL